MTADAPRGLVARVLAAYPNVRASMARELAAGRDEPQLLAYVMGGAAVLFVASLPRIVVAPPAEVAAMGEDGAFGFFLANLITFIFFAPLFLYGVAALARIVARAFGGTGGWRDTRLATFWALMVNAPVLLVAALAGMMLRLTGAAGFADAVGMAAGLACAWVWSACLAEAHGFARVWPVLLVQIAIVGGLAVALAMLGGVAVTAR